MPDPIDQSKSNCMSFIIKLALAVIILPPVCAFGAYYEVGIVCLLLLPWVEVGYEPFILAVVVLTIIQYIVGLVLIIK